MWPVGGPLAKWAQMAWGLESPLEVLEGMAGIPCVLGYDPYCGASGWLHSCLVFHLSGEDSGAGEMAQQVGRLMLSSRVQTPAFA